MTQVTERYAQNQAKPVFICDFSPPRGADVTQLEQIRELKADFVNVAYNPGKSVRVDSAIMAYLLKSKVDTEVIFTIGCRDRNKLAMQTHLLGAQMLGLENVVVVQGDNFTDGELTDVKDVSDFTTTELIQSIKSMNDGLDYRGKKLRAPTNFCVGATVDLGRNLEQEALLAYRKTQAGADFFITQAFHEMPQAAQFLDAYQRVAGKPLDTPIFYGVQILDRGGPVFGHMPDWIRHDLDGGRAGTDIAVELLLQHLGSGARGIYLVPPILRGGRRDYASAQRVLEAIHT